jgi:hypothetical protein
VVVEFSFDPPVELQAGRYYFMVIRGPNQQWGVRRDFDTAYEQVNIYQDSTYQDASSSLPSPLTGESQGTGDMKLRMYIIGCYYDWSASWSWYPLPLSVVAMPVGQQLVLGLLGGLICFTAIVKLSPRKQRKRGVRKR